MGYYWDELAPEVIWLGGGGGRIPCVQGFGFLRSDAFVTVSSCPASTRRLGVKCLHHLPQISPIQHQRQPPNFQSNNQTKTEAVTRNLFIQYVNISNEFLSLPLTYT